MAWLAAKPRISLQNEASHYAVFTSRFYSFQMGGNSLILPLCCRRSTVSGVSCGRIEPILPEGEKMIHQECKGTGFLRFEIAA